MVRNDELGPARPTHQVRKALPDKIVFTIGQPAETIYDRLIADSGNDKIAVTSERTPPAYYTQIQGEVADRAVNVESPYVNYLVPNFTKVKNLKVRQAIAMATDATARGSRPMAATRPTARPSRS